MVGKEIYEYGKNFGEMRSIDLANRNIPEEIFSLIELKALNISRNMLTGIIPKNISKLEQLESLDLSRNHFSGSSPVSMVGLHYLGYLDLSYNKLSGRIPTGTQLQSFDPSKYMGNAGLCGPPLIEKCPEDVTSNVGGSKNLKKIEMEEVKTIKEIETNSGSVFLLVQGLDSLLVFGESVSL